MKKSFAILLSLLLTFVLISGCGVVQNDPDVVTEGGVKTGLAVLTTSEKSKDAGEENGLAQVDSTVVAVTVDAQGIITNCVIDAVQTKINITSEGKIGTDLATLVKTKQELGEEYGMKKVSSIGKEWSEQAQALAQYVIGKSLQQVKGISVNEKMVPTQQELAGSVTISIGGYIAAIEKAVNNAKDLGAAAEDKLGVGIITNIAKSTNAGDKEGVAQAYSNFVVATFDESGKTTSCIIDGSQANVKFDATGKITSGKNEIYKTKNELGEGYGMAKVSGIGKEWFEQAASFAQFITGKTPADVKGITINQAGAPEVEELKSSVTISVKDYMAAFEKAAATAK